ncbi:hypothetical protein CKAH01_18924 [Colletotrichum kahawae]|uniref:Uncharacterized protein n=1 Tax=Colletotrichum kahawae TaxID=34407 RepID=A0AAE0D0L9_COLKA|nr:hypothetical protein CKAH01_18924 [Colletotrichum kahawae]
MTPVSASTITRSAILLYGVLS